MADLICCGVWRSGRVVGSKALYMVLQRLADHLESSSAVLDDSVYENTLPEGLRVLMIVIA